MMASSRRDDGRVLPIFLSMIAFMGLLALVATPSYEGIVEEERVLRAREVIDAVDAACRRHHVDTGRLALEYAPKNENDAYNAKRYHHLSAPQLYSGWKGPYISLGLSRADNPWGGTIELRDNLSTHPALGFELDGGLRMHERGQYLLFTQVPAEAARLIDVAFDGESGDGWDVKGRVEYVLDDGGTLSIFLLALGD